MIVTNSVIILSSIDQTGRIVGGVFGGVFCSVGVGVLLIVTVIIITVRNKKASSL